MNPTVIGALKSKTVWAGVLTTLIAAVNYAAPFIPPQYAPLLLAASGLVQVGLRTITSKPLAEK